MTSNSIVELNSLIWPEKNKGSNPIVLRTYNEDPAKVRLYTIPPDGQIIFPKQAQFLRALFKYDAVLYGGAVFGGKSYVLRWGLIWLLVKWALPPVEGGFIDTGNPDDEGGLGLKNVEVGLFCESYKALEDRHFGKFKQMPSYLGKFIGVAREFRLSEKFGSGVIKLRNLDDYDKYASSEFAAIAVDELTYNPKQTFDFLLTRRRWPPIKHCPILCATNPGQIGHAWVYKAFVNPETRVQAEYDEELDYQSHGYHFIQSLPSDNPLATKQYLANMKKWPEKQRRALAEGDWTVFEGQYFQMLDPNIHWVPDFEIPDNWQRIRVIDHGGAHPAVCLWMALDPATGHGFVYREYSRAEEYSEFHKKQIVQMSGKEQYRLTVGDPKMWTKQYSMRNNSTPAEVYNDASDKKLGSLFMTRANDARMQGWQALSNAFGYEIEAADGSTSTNAVYGIDKEGRPLIKFVRAPKLYVFRSCVFTWSSLSNLQHDAVKLEDAKKTKGYYEPGQGDDEAECVRYGWLAFNPTAGGESSVHPNDRSERSKQMLRNSRPRTKNPYAWFG